MIWDNVHEYQKEELDMIQNKAARIVTGCAKLVSIADLIRESGWETLRERRKNTNSFFFSKW